MGATALTDQTIVIIERDPFVAEDISATLGNRFPDALLRVFSDFVEARPSLSPGAAPLLAVVSLSERQPTEFAEDGRAALLGRAVVLIDGDASAIPTGVQAWRQISKPFTQEMLIEAAERALTASKARNRKAGDGTECSVAG